MKKISILLLTIICLQVFSQAPQGMNYQAVVRDALGNPITNHAIGVKFKIHQGSGSGTVVYEETQTPTSDPFGSISLVIGQGSVVTGVFANINWSSGIYFNEVLIDVSGGNSYLSMGASQLMSVPYSLYSEKTNEHQTLSINGNNLSISGGNAITLPSSGGSNVGLFTQTMSVGTGYTFGNATQETNVDSFVITVNWTQGLNYAGTFIVKKDPLTGVYQVTGNGPSEGPCSGNGVNMHAATTHQGAIYYVYTNFCDNKKVSSSIGNVTIDVPPTNSNGMIFSDGQYIYLNNNSTNFFAYSVAGTQFTFHHILSFNCNAGCAVMCDGSYIFRLCGGTLSKYSLTGTLISSKSATGTGLVNIDATKLFLLNSSFLPTSTTPTFTTTIIMTPISKP